MVPTRVKKNLATTYSPNLLWLVPSATRVLTAEFGMGSGVSLSLWPPEKYQITGKFPLQGIFIHLNRHLSASYCILPLAKPKSLLLWLMD